MLDGPLFLLCLGDCSILLGLNVWFLIILSDLECDYINASSACSQLNSLILVSYSEAQTKRNSFLAWNHNPWNWNVLFDNQFSLDTICNKSPDTILSSSQVYQCPEREYRFVNYDWAYADGNLNFKFSFAYVFL